MEESNTNLATKKRLLLSWYIDFLFFMALWGLLSYFMKLEESVPFWTPYLAFLLIRAITSKCIGSIGFSFLSIDKNTMCVNEEIFRRENWLSILLGVLLILEGTKQLVRWTQMFVSQPAFGYFPDETTQIIIHLALGSISILAGYWFLKLNIRGFIAGISVTLISVISDALSWKLWDPVVEKMVLTRREVQGLPVRDGEVEMMQSLMPEGMLVVAGVSIIAMAVTYPRFKNA